MLSVQNLAVLGFAAVAQAHASGWNGTAPVYTTVTTDIYTTFCPEATTFTQGTKTYTATASQTLTITDCPCTYSYSAKPTPYPTQVPHSYVAPPPHQNATYTPVWVTTTEVVKSYTTYCPAPTTIVQNSKTYTITKATTLTITDCPCTATKTYPGTTTTVLVGSTTTYCPEPTTITIGVSTYPVTTPGTFTVPIYSTVVVPIPGSPAATYPASAPSAPYPTGSVETSGSAAPTTAIPVAPYPSASIETSGFASPSAGPSPTGPVQVGNGAGVRSVGLGAMVAGLIAMVL
ncbi:hypothetical protein WAI453_002658 [Rhynchosporium graminicola]|uniref:SED1-abundant cell surface glycoprotein n=1 Tax=Rhynchosporium graminicola TaxID=2792576 RepID=A0A1E1JU75_9HELO|nr:uncharacterized protein RCO7_08994 [Rhynchosporium commune]